MNDYTKGLKWAVVHVIDRSTQDDRRSKVCVDALFRNPVSAEDNYMPHLPNREVKRYLLHIESLETFERFYNFVQDLNEEYGDYAIYHLCDGNFLVEDVNRFRTILDLWTDTKIGG